MGARKETTYTDNIAKLQWACRRGMLELDVLLGNFLKTAYPCLSLEDKQHFVELLSYPDPELLDLLMGRMVAEEPNLVRIVEAIRHHAKSRI